MINWGQDSETKGAFDNLKKHFHRLSATQEHNKLQEHWKIFITDIGQGGDVVSIA